MLKAETRIGHATISPPPGGRKAVVSPKAAKAHKKKQKTKPKSKPKTDARLRNLEARWSVGFVVFFTTLFLSVIAMKLVMEYKAAREEVTYARALATTNYAEQVNGKIQEVSGRLQATGKALTLARISNPKTLRALLADLTSTPGIEALALTSATGTIQASKQVLIDREILTAGIAAAGTQNSYTGVIVDENGTSQIIAAQRVGSGKSIKYLIATVSARWLQGSVRDGHKNLLSDRDGNPIGDLAVQSSGSIPAMLGMDSNDTAYHVRTRLVGAMEGKDKSGQKLAIGLVTLFSGDLVVYQASELTIDNAAWTRTLVFFLLMTIAPLLVAASLVVILLKQMDGLRHTRQALADSDARFRLAIEGARSGVFDWDLHSDRVLVTDSLARMFGRAKGATVSVSEFMSMVHVDDREKLRAAVRGAPESGEIDVEFRAANLPVWFQARGRPWQVQNGMSSGRIVGVAIDITEQKGAQARLNAAETRLRAALESMSESFVVWDARRRLIMCNRKFSDFFGIELEYLRTGIAYEELELMAARSIKAIHEGRDDSAVEMELTDGRWVHLSERKTAEGGMVSIGTDITAMKMQETLLVKNESALIETVADLEASQSQISELAESFQQEKFRAEEANRSKSEFLANMSHELRTPLNAINGFSEIMQKEMFGPLGDDRYLEYVGDILQSGQHLLNLINDILDMSKIESGKMTLSTETIYCDELIEQCLRLVRGRAVESNLQLVSKTAEIPGIEADPRAVKQVLLNVLSNAIKFTPEGGTVTAHTDPDPDTGGVIFQITDTGIGISAQDLPKLCTPFSQIESQHSKSHKGSGLGLALTKSLVELHGGQFTIESEIGIGTTVTVKLPKVAVSSETDLQLAISDADEEAA
jgi:two-component system cell cycle sensor histidine kinase PleC